jgi:deoxyribodipyrimidine photolyase-related protein
VHVATDGLRKVPGLPEPGPLEPARPSWLGADRPLPEVFWGSAPSGLHCLDTVVHDVWDEAYGHHITRLMVLSNLATLLDVSPRELTDWFWVAYADAFDWVVEPNVLGMGTYAAGPLMTTKPYVSGAAYLAKMSDYCQSCAFDPKTTCPVTRLYWAFLARHEARLPGPRMAMPLVSVRKRSAAERAADAEEFHRVSRALTEGERLTPR